MALIFLHSTFIHFGWSLVCLVVANTDASKTSACFGKLLNNLQELISLEYAWTFWTSSPVDTFRMKCLHLSDWVYCLPHFDTQLLGTCSLWFFLNNPWLCIELIRLTFVHKCIKVFCVVTIVYLLHVLATLVAILRDVHYKWWIFCWNFVFYICALVHKLLWYLGISNLCNVPPWGWPQVWLKHVGGILSLENTFVHLCAFVGFITICNCFRVFMKPPCCFFFKFSYELFGGTKFPSHSKVIVCCVLCQVYF